MEGTGADAAAAVVAGREVQLGRCSALLLDDMDGAGLGWLAEAAGPAFFQIQPGHPLADDADIVEHGLYAVVRAAAHGDLELMG